MAGGHAESLFSRRIGYDVSPGKDGWSAILRKEGGDVRYNSDPGWMHALGSASFTNGRFRVEFEERCRTERFEAPINIGVADAEDKKDTEKESFIIWINSTEMLPGFNEGFFWNGTLCGMDTGGYCKGINIAGISPLTVDVIVEDGSLFFAINGQEPVEAFTNLPKLVCPYLFMYGDNELTYYPPLTRIVTVQEGMLVDEDTLSIRCTSLSGEVTSIQAQMKETVADYKAALREELSLSGAVDLQVRDTDGFLLDNELPLRQVSSGSEMSVG